MPARGGSSSKVVLLAFVQPVAMGVLLGHGWHTYSEALARGSTLGLGLCSAGVLLGLLAAVLLCARAAPAQAAFRLSLFWMSCALNGGLSAIAQLRMRIGKFHANDDALAVNSFLASGLLGTSLPHVVFKVARCPEAEVVMPCALAALLTEALCSSETMPVLKVGVSTFLFAVGIQGVAADGSGSNALGGAGMGSGEVNCRSAGGGGYSAGPPAHEPFFPATVMGSRRYSPHFLVGRRNCSSGGAGAAVPLVSLLPRQSQPEPSRAGGKGGKERAPRGPRQPRAADEPLAAASVAAAAPATAGLASPVPLGAPLGHSAQASGALASREPGDELKQQSMVVAADVGSDIRWDVVFEEMRRVDHRKANVGKTNANEAAECSAVGDGPIEVFAEFADEGAEDDGLQLASNAASSDPPLDAPAPSFGDEDDGLQLVSSAADGDLPLDVVASSFGPGRAGQLQSEEDGLPPPISRRSDASPRAPSANEVELNESVAEPQVEPQAQEWPGQSLAYPAPAAEESPQFPYPAQQLRHIPLVGNFGLNTSGEDEEFDAPWLETRLPKMPVDLAGGHQVGRESQPAKEASEEEALGFDGDNGRTWEGGCAVVVPPLCTLAPNGESTGLPLIALNENSGGTPLAATCEHRLDDAQDAHGIPHGGEPAVLLPAVFDAQQESVASSLLSAAAEEFVPVDPLAAAGPVETERADTELGTTAHTAGQAEVPLRILRLRPEAEAFCPRGIAAMGVLPGLEASQEAAPSGPAELGVDNPAPDTAAAGDAPAGDPGEVEHLLQQRTLDLAGGVGAPNLGGNFKQPQLSYTEHNYHDPALLAGAADDQWSTPFAGPDWGPGSRDGALQHCAQDDLQGEKKAFGGYGFPEDGWNGYGAYGGESWGAYNVYGGGEYPQTCYDYEGQGVSTLGLLSAHAAEFVPSCWDVQGQQLGVGAQTEESSGGLELHDLTGPGGADSVEPVSSLMDPEFPDPGPGRASEVRRVDALSLDDVVGQAGTNHGGNNSQQRTLWVGDVEPWMTEAYISGLFADMALVTNVQIVSSSSSSRASVSKTSHGHGHALVEFASHNAAAGVLEALGGEVIVAKDGKRLGVRWSSSPDASVAEAARLPNREMHPGKGRMDRRGKRDRINPGEGARDAGDRDANAAAISESGGHAEGGRRGRRGEGAVRNRDEAEGAPQQWRTRGGRTDARAEALPSTDVHDGMPSEARSEGGRWAARAKAGRGGKGGPDRRELCCWAYVDPNEQVQAGFTMEEMRQWYHFGYFDGELRLALMHCSAEEAKFAVLPPPQEFYPLRQWFPDPARSFTYVPKF